MNVNTTFSVQKHDKIMLPRRTMSKKVQVNFDDGALEVIDRLKEATGSNAGDVIRDALSFYEWARQQHDEGKKVGTIENGRGVSEVVLPFELRRKISKSRSGNHEGK
jgi:hypothetical protein